jgi:2-C-methyl-D-erythritol 2,4-cyclodiphosphate synthase
MDLLTRVIEMLTERGFEVTNVDVTVMAEKPRLRPYVDSMRERLGLVMGVEVERVSVKAKTNEGLESVGRNESMAAQAVALIHRIKSEQA